MRPEEETKKRLADVFREARDQALKDGKSLKEADEAAGAALSKARAEMHERRGQRKAEVARKKWEIDQAIWKKKR